MANNMEGEFNSISEDEQENNSFDRSNDTIIEKNEADINDLELLKAELSALKMFVAEQIFLIKQQLGTSKIGECESTNDILLSSLNEQINYLKEENKLKSIIIQSLSQSLKVS